MINFFILKVDLPAKKSKNEGEADIQTPSKLHPAASVNEKKTKSNQIRQTNEKSKETIVLNCRLGLLIGLKGR